jgi:hypothetical protein
VICFEELEYGNIEELSTTQAELSHKLKKLEFPSGGSVKPALLDPDALFFVQPCSPLFFNQETNRFSDGD